MTNKSDKKKKKSLRLVIDQKMPKKYKKLFIFKLVRQFSSIIKEIREFG